MRMAPPAPGLATRIATGALLLALIAPLLACLHAQQENAYLPVGQGFAWPKTTAHTQLADQMIQAIPPAVSVSAQTELVPHLSNRRFIYLYPYGAHAADYVLLDTTTYQYNADLTPDLYCNDLSAMFADPNYTLAQADDGLVLFARGPAAGTSIRNEGGQQPAQQNASLDMLPFRVPGCDIPPS